MTKITETTFQESSLTGRVDEAAGVIHGVKLLGEISRNGRRYKPEAMQSAIPLYEGRKSFINHAKKDDIGNDRPFQDWSGVFRKVRYESGNGVVGDFHLRKKGEYYEGIIEAARDFPNDVGFSHVAEGESHMDGSTEIIESITEVHSVDLVTNPATTAGFFESHRKPKTKTVRDAVESLPADQPLRKRLVEMIDAGYMNGDQPLDGEKDKPTDPLTAALSLIRDMTVALSDSLKALAEANKPAAPIVAPLEGPPEEEEDDEMLTPEQKAAKAEEEDKKAKAFESLQRENAELKASKLLLESGHEAKPAWIKALAAADDAGQKEFIESLPVTESVERPHRSPALIESADASPENIRNTFAAIAR